ncbi:oxidoreductase [Flavobacterium sp. H122]|uniref:WD40/YVTN/BNR-like repeat-containing protein n=1 Tax=Flavobacterium sp. H122 TaxID=2529860 RepID=UPI0020BF1D05|nr:oxidoreductase [Flavobacterium sp. H122]
MKLLSIRLAVVFMIFIQLSCSTDKNLIKSPGYTQIVVDTLLNEKMSSRALAIDKDKVWYGASNGKYGYISLNGAADFSAIIEKENLKLEFRSLAQTPESVFILSVANPALLYKIDKESKQISLVYEEKHEKVFYDAILFMNEKEGIAIGDPTDGCPSIIKTSDGGNTWNKLSCTGLPKFAEGEAFFAASNTNITYRNGKLFMVSGGVKSKFYVSADKGETWIGYETPIVQGKAMTGVFTSDFYDENIGIIAGGNYEKLEQNLQNKAITFNGGKKWKLIAENAAFGYASCVQFLPDTNGKCILTAGATGVFYSRDSGKKWQQLLPDKDFIAFRFIDNKTAVASGKNRIVKFTLK